MPRSIRPAGRTIAILITLLSGVVLAAARMPAPGDACSLLTKEDAAAALGEPAMGPKAKGPLPSGDGATVSTCGYTGSGIHSITLTLMRLPANAVATYKGMCEQQSKDGLAGLGDVACWYNGKHGELHSIKGTAFLSIELRGSGDPSQPIKAAMTRVLAHLK